MTEWTEWYNWRGSAYRDDSPEVRFMIVCEGSHPTSFTNYYEIDEAASLVSPAEYAEYLKEIPKVHGPFLMGSVTIDREGQVTIRPRYRETMVVDAADRKITLRCRCRTDRGECKYQQVLTIDHLIVALTQINGVHPDIRMDDKDPALVSTWSVSEHLVGAMDEDLQAEYEVKKRQAIAAYRVRRKPEIVTDKKGQVLAVLP